MPKEDWRSPTAYNYTKDLNPSGLAWEFLRRNPDYRADYSSAGHQAASETGAARPARRWGLRFLERPRPPRRRGGNLLAPRTTRKRRHPHGKPG